MRPVLVVGDAPSLPTGLARIARELCMHLHQDSAELGIKVAQLGLGYRGEAFPWPIFPATDDSDWAAQDLLRIWPWWSGGKPGIILTVWDPARCFPIAQLPRHEGVKLWGYFAIDAENPKGEIGGPAAAGLRKYDKLIAYSRFGRKVLAKTLGLELDDPCLAWLPHGYDPQVFKPREPFEVADRLGGLGIPGELMGRHWLGCVAANQARKDFGTFFAAAKELREVLGPAELTLWLHTDAEVGRDYFWSIPELASVYDFNSPEKLVVTTALDDSALACFYSKCHMTFAPGLGEGFGYPIVESLACGVPVVHVDYAGGAEFTPTQWLVQPAGWRVEGPYVLKRPILDPVAVADKLSAAARFAREDMSLAEAYCRGSVEHLAWPNLWPHWKELFTKWLGEA